MNQTFHALVIRQPSLLRVLFQAIRLHHTTYGTIVDNNRMGDERKAGEMHEHKRIGVTHIESQGLVGTIRPLLKAKGLVVEGT